MFNSWAGTREQHVDALIVLLRASMRGEAKFHAGKVQRKGRSSERCPHKQYVYTFLLCTV